MAKTIAYIGSVQCVIVSILIAATTVICDDATPIPPVAAEVNKWFEKNVAPVAGRKATLEPALAAAEAAPPKRITVKADGSGDFKTVTAALASIPSGNEKRVIVDIGPGEFTEKITVERTKPFVTLLGVPEETILQFDGTALKYGTVYSASLTVEGDYFVASNLIIKNTAPRPDGKAKGAQAVALRVAADKAAFYNCRVIGFQDTVCDDKGRHFFKDCYIEGTVDFIFGSGKSLYLTTTLNVIKDQFQTVITAQAKHTKAEDSGFSFVHNKIEGDAVDTLLGRAWMEMPEVVFAFTDMGKVINPVGWSNYNHPEREKDLVFGEYKNTGTGGDPKGRVKFCKQFTEKEVAPYISLGYIEGSKWLLPPPK